MPHQYVNLQESAGVRSEMHGSPEPARQPLGGRDVDWNDPSGELWTFGSCVRAETATGDGPGAGGYPARVSEDRTARTRPVHQNW